MNEIHALQLGKVNWNEIYTLPADLILDYVETYTEAPEKPYDLVLWDRLPLEEELEALYQSTKAYTLFVTKDVLLNPHAKWLYESRKGQLLAKDDIQRFLLEETRFYFPKPYGEKYNPNNLTVSRNFSGSVQWDGQYALELQGEFGEDMQQIAYWRNNIPLFPHQVIDFWLEYKKTPGVEISLVITRMPNGSLSDIIARHEFTERELKHTVHIEAGATDERIFVSISAKGAGELKIIALHDRYSRGTHGHFLPGGERYVTTDREEIFCYFEPMDRKPPLNVFFSGYKTAEGFEGYGLMHSMGCPFLLIGEPRLEGGSFYMGSGEYEQLLTDVLNRYISELGFSADEVILSGISMGTYGAMYYGCGVRPHALLLGKPLASIGDVAANEQRFRPGGFPTSLDVLHYICGDTNAAAVQKLNDKFWNRFDVVDWSKTKFVVSYMIEDDYDATAYQKLLSHIQSEGVQVYGRGYHGRHNDNTGGIVSWFSSQFKKLLREDFDRNI